MTISQSPELVTPELAQKWLAGNIGNRKFAPAHVRFLADQIRAGQWQTTPDTIKLSTTGRLLDGQHRLTAIVETGMAQHLYIARDCDDAIFTVLDTGKGRSAADVVSISGEKNATHVASIARLIYFYENGGLKPSATKHRKASNADVLTICNRVNLSVIASRSTTLYSRSKALNVAEYGFLIWLLSSRDALAAETFLKTISTGIGLNEGSPLLMLLRKLNAARMGERFKFSPAERIALTIKAWNLYRLKKPCTQLIYNVGKEDFPVPV